MLTDCAPRKPALRASFFKSEKTRILNLAGHNQLTSVASRIESSLNAGNRDALRIACAEFLEILAGYYKVETPPIRILAARSIPTREGG
jgi:hypothetical protein